MLYDDLVKIEWKDEDEDEEEKLTNGVKQISINGMDENTKGIPKVTIPQYSFHSILSTLTQYTFNSSTISLPQNTFDSSTLFF